MDQVDAAFDVNEEVRQCLNREDTGLNTPLSRRLFGGSASPPDDKDYMSPKNLLNLLGGEDRDDTSQRPDQDLPHHLISVSSDRDTQGRGSYGSSPPFRSPVTPWDTRECYTPSRTQNREGASARLYLISPVGGGNSGWMEELASRRDINRNDN